MTLIDAVAVNGGTGVRNLIADFAKGGGDNISWRLFSRAPAAANAFENATVIW